MKREKRKVKLKRKKPRRKWLINPRTRVHDEVGYKRGKQKKNEKRRIKEELQDLERRDSDES